MGLSGEKNYSIAIIVCFFGEFPNYIDLWLKSCVSNPTVDWILFSDHQLDCAPQNVHIFPMTLPELRQLIGEKLGFPVTLDRPYKLCDFKPVYGLVFEEYLKGYDFWGHCDLDMIFGDFRKFITRDILEKYDKVLWFGHLTLYRNNSEVNQRYKLPGTTVDYKTAFCTDKDYAFDEVWMNKIYRCHQLPIYNKTILIDIIFYRRHYSGFNMRNYQRQVFFWENGRIFQAYPQKGKIQYKEFLYIHFQKRTFDKFLFDVNANAFYISPDGFHEKTPGVIKPGDFQKYNKNPGLLYEFIVMQWYFVKLRYSRLFKWLKGKL